MKKLSIKNFKAFKEELIIDFGNNKNLLLYGENGTGKSSIYEAIKVIFFRDKLESMIPQASTPEEEKIHKNAFWEQYNNKQFAQNFEIKLNERFYSDFEKSNYKVFMIAMDRFCFQEKIRLDELLESFDLQIDNIGFLCDNSYELIQNRVNQKLKEFQEIGIKITIDNEDDYSIKIEDTIKGLDYKNNLSNYFNEAKLNLIILLLLFESILISKQNDKKILILDDFITSLDIANRTFLIKYIFDNFNDFQKVILTHNVYFYNLIMYLVNDIYKEKSKWIFANLYEINNKHKFYVKGALTVNTIRQRYNDNMSSEEIESVGNDIRKRFEQLLHEFSKLLMIGAVEENKKIIEKIENTGTVYKNGKKTSLDLVMEIEEILEEDRLKEKIYSKINNYKIDNLLNFQDIIRGLKLYQKVTMHPMSHNSSEGLTSFTQKEIEKSLELLEKLEKDIKNLIGSSVEGA